MAASSCFSETHPPGVWIRRACVQQLLDYARDFGPRAVFLLRRGGRCLAADQQRSIVFIAIDDVVAPLAAYPAGLDQARMPRVQKAAAGNRVSPRAIVEVGGPQASTRDQG